VKTTPPGAVEPAGGHTLRVIAAGAGLGMGFLDRDLRYVEGNSALALVFGVRSVIGRRPSDLGATGKETEALVRRVLRTGRPITIGAPTARVSYYRVLASDGKPLGVCVVAIAETTGDLHLDELKLEAQTDGLTGLVNHRGFQERLRLEVIRAYRHARPLSLAMIDIDGFKQLNDTFGHQVGDDVLESVARHLAAATRTSDMAARIGGDEFALLLPETDARAAAAVAERAHEQIRRDTHDSATGVTISIGICDLEFAHDADELLRFADGALYWAKANGRDVVCLYSPEAVEDLSLAQRGDRLLRNKALAGIRSLARAIDAKDHSTLLHSERVASLAARLAEADGWSPERVASLRETALVHDVGKIGVPVELLLKPAALTPAEYEVVKRHAALGAQIAADVLSGDQASWLRGHHERYDGTGYPDGLAGDAIPEGACILALADSWDVMTSERSYSRAMNTSEAIAECTRCSGTHFSPCIVTILTRPAFERVLRMFANEQSTRDRNELRFASDHRSSFHLRCECGADNCHEMVDVPADDYRAVRRAERRYIVKTGHEIDEIEQTLITTLHYSIVEKI
jgi:diguanylate cyclase (GGDEF)-like protein